ncbi:eukaryotic translation initiation factor 4 gamma 1 isoform X2 [Diachasma alloeum]|uniref:eukaryotic translation initiation factor 4 gamma 1 isoform X2 n=1 Tax=Diachasma alloeum TaxID=454923 RepID=UPI0007383905|nr:eukaryotic translation initiation factor 4 gamma 1 isoform X2 [Diachasma alloeum]
MVSRYGVAKEGAVGVAVGVGPMHCLLPHCGGPHHHLSTHHPHNPNHNHVHTHNHQPPSSQPPPSPHGPHIGQMNHGQHQLTINIGQHHPQQQQQQLQGQHQQPPPQYRIVTTNARSEFHVPGQNYGAQPGAQVGGGGGSIGVPGGRGPSLGGIPQIGQSTPGIQSSGQQQPPQPPTPGVQQQQPQGPAQTTTPPVHTPSPQDMSKQGHLQAQPPSLQQQFVPNQTRPVTQTFYQMGPRQPQTRNIHRGNQSGTPHVVAIPNVATSTGQPPAIYQPNIAVPGTPPLYVSGQVSNLPPAPMYSMNNHIQPLLAYPSQQRHPPHQSPPFFPGYPPHAILPQNVYGGYATGHQQWNFYQQTHTPPNSSMNLNRASANPVSGGGQNVGGPLVGAQGTAGVPQGALQQQQPPPQPIPPMAMSLQQPTYPGHNRSAQTPVNTYQKVSTRAHAIMDIVNPDTGENVAGEIYRNAAAPEDIKPRETPQPQNSAIAAEFASRVAKAASESGDNPPSANVQEHNHTPSSSSTTTPNITNVKPQINTNKEPINTQCNNVPITPVQSNVPRSSNPDSHLAAQETCQVKVDSKSGASVAKEWPRNDTKQQIIHQDEHRIPPPIINKDNIPPEQSSPIPPATDSEAKISTTAVATGLVVPQSANTAPQAAKESFSSTKAALSSPPRRKPHQLQLSAAQVMLTATTAIDSPAVIIPALSTPTSEPIREHERELGETSPGSKDNTPSPTNNQTEEHQHLQKNGEAVDKSEEIKAEQKSPDVKGTQKQKNKKPKGRDLNRKGAEKEGTDMDAFSVPQPVKTNAKIQPDHLHETQPIKAVSSIETSNENSVKDKGTPEGKPDNELESMIQLDQETVNSETIRESSELQQPERNVQNHKDVSKETTPTESSNKSLIVPEKGANDVVDHANMTDVNEVAAIVAQKNEENAKVSGLPRTHSETKTASVIDKQNENEPPNQSEAKAPPQLKYQYDDDQWSPKNVAGKKRYGRDLLMKLQEDPKSRVRPPNLLDLEVVLKDSTRQPIRNVVDLSAYKGNRTHETLFPGFAKSSFNAKLPPPPNKKSYQGSKKPPKPNVIHVSLSLREDVKLRETENAWKPTRLKSEMLPGEEAKSQALYKKVRSVLNKLTPQKFNTLVNQVRALEIDTQERLQGVIDLVFEKAVDEPSFSVAYALMCKELSGMKVSTGEKRVDETGKKVDVYVDFRKLLVTRCQMEFEKNMVDESARAAKVQEIENTTDPEKKKELQFNLSEEDRRIRMKSVGNIRFIGELYKQEMLIAKIMHTCVKHLLATPDEENLECLCKLLTTIGKTLEPKSEPSVFPGYFNQLAELSSKKSSKKISSRVRFMIQDVIDLRASQWIPRRDDSNPKTMDQIQKEAESERLEIQMNNCTPMNTPRKDDRNNDRRRNRGGGGGGGGGGSEDGWTVATLGKTNRQPYSIEASKLNAKSLPLDEIKLGNRSAYLFGGSAAAAKPNTLGTPNKYAALENLEQDKQRVTPQLPGSRSTGAREYGRSDQYKGWEGRGSRNGGHVNSSSMSSSREGSLLEASRSQSVSMPTQSMKYKPPPAMVMPSNPISSKPPKTEEQLNKIIRVVLDMCNGPQTDAFITDAVDTVKEHFDNSTYPLFVRETLNSILEKPGPFRQRFAALYAYMINNNMIPLSLFQSEYEKILEIADDLVIDIPKCWTYFAEILSEIIRLGAHTLAELKKTTAVLKSMGSCGKLMGELLSKLAKDLGPKVVADKWDQSGLRWADLVDTSHENPDDIVQRYKLEFLTSDCIGTEKCSGAELTLEQIHDQLVNLMRGSHFDNITGWISANVGGKSKQPQFIRVLVTAILEVSMEPIPAVGSNSASWKLNSEIFKSLLPLITRYVDTEPHLELQCLFAIQVYVHKLEHPQGVLGNVIDALCEGSIISDDAFLSWQKCTDPAEMMGHAVAVVTLTSFFVSLGETLDESSEEA